MRCRARPLLLVVSLGATIAFRAVPARTPGTLMAHGPAAASSALTGLRMQQQRERLEEKALVRRDGLVGPTVHFSALLISAVVDLFSRITRPAAALDVTPPLSPPPDRTRETCLLYL